MNVYEKNEIQDLPEKYRPLSAWAYVGYSLLFCIPLVGFIMAIVFSFSDSNINRRNFARAYFCGLLVVVIIVILLDNLLAGALGSGYAGARYFR